MSPLRRLKYFLKFRADKAAFLAKGGSVAKNHAILDDYYKPAGTATGHYFHQDLLVASLIHQAQPTRHIDVGSSVEGFVSHVASFRDIEVFDIRPLQIHGHPQIRFVQGNLMELDPRLIACCDSLSCLHALEHFGLGRYGDPIDPEGHLKGFANLARMLQPGGIFYLSFPIGAAGVHFNAHRVFDPSEPLQWAAGQFELLRFDYVNDQGELQRNSHPSQVGALNYGCGIYTLRKLR
jgi:SAM-dependent methyltransferase